jgi:hypothetical protein
MIKSGRSRPIIALAAAYAIALQILLLPLSVAAGGAFPFSLCSAGASAGASVGNAQAPASHQNGCPCAGGCGMHCGVHALAGPPQTLVTIGLPQVRAPMLLPAFAGAVQPATCRAHFARGPPAA